MLGYSRFWYIFSKIFTLADPNVCDVLILRFASILLTSTFLKAKTSRAHKQSRPAKRVIQICANSLAMCEGATL